MDSGARVADIIGAGPLSTDRLLRVGTGLAELVARAHAGGATFGALTPATILLGAGDEVSVLDAGQAPISGRREDDLLAVGSLLYAMATGRDPYGTAELAGSGPPSPIEFNPRLPSGLVQVIRTAVHPDRAARFASADEIVAALHEVRRAPGSLESLLPLHHVSSSSRVKPPPRPAPDERELDDQPKLWEEPAEEDDAGPPSRGLPLPG